MDVQGLGSQFPQAWTVSFFLLLSDPRGELTISRQTICTFVFLEMHRKAYRKVQDLGEGEPQ